MKKHFKEKFKNEFLLANTNRPIRPRKPTRFNRLTWFDGPTRSSRPTQEDHGYGLWQG